jgi:hypothetical protein
VFLAGGGLYITLSAAATGAATRTEKPSLYVGVYATAADAGLAVGPLLAYSLGDAVGLLSLYVVAGTMLTLAVLRYWWTERASLNASPHE